jgi:hypothetical protein
MTCVSSSAEAMFVRTLYLSIALTDVAQMERQRSCCASPFPHPGLVTPQAGICQTAFES